MIRRRSARGTYRTGAANRAWTAARSHPAPRRRMPTKSYSNRRGRIAESSCGTSQISPASTPEFRPQARAVIATSQGRSANFLNHEDQHPFDGRD